MGSSSECYVLKWDEFHSSVANSFTDLRNEEDFLDVTVAIDQDHQLQAHKVVLSASSPYFREILKRNPAQHPVLVMPPAIKFADLAAVVDFIYQGEVKIPINQVDDFVSLAQMLKIRGLTEDLEKVDGKKKTAIPQARLPPGTLMSRKRSSGGPPPPQQPPVPSPQAKRARGPILSSQLMGNPAKFPPMQAGPSTAPVGPEEGDDGIPDDDLHEVDDEDGNEIYGEYDEQYGQEFGMQDNSANPPAQQQAQQAGLQLTGLFCPKCRAMCHGVEALKDHMIKAHGMPGADAQPPAGQEENKKTHVCHICDKAFKGLKNVRAHLKRVHKITGNPPSAQEHHDEEGMMMEHVGGEGPPTPAPEKKKGRPKKSEQMQGRPIGQVTPAPRGSHEMKGDMHEQSSRPPVQQDRGASPMMARQRPPGMMSPNSGQSKRPMNPQGILGPGMRPRGPIPQQFHPQQGYSQPQTQQAQQGQQPMDIKKLGMKLGGAISITSSESGYPGGSGPQPQSSSRRPIPSTSRMHASSPKNDPLTSQSRPPSLPPRHGSQEQPVEVKMEPMDDMYEEGEDMQDDYEDFGEEEEEEEDYDGQDEGMYGGEAPYDEDVDHDGGGYHHQ